MINIFFFFSPGEPRAELGKLCSWYQTPFTFLHEVSVSFLYILHIFLLPIVLVSSHAPSGKGCLMGGEGRRARGGVHEQYFLTLRHAERTGDVGPG